MLSTLPLVVVMMMMRTMMTSECNSRNLSASCALSLGVSQFVGFLLQESQFCLFCLQFQNKIQWSSWFYVLTLQIRCIRFRMLFVMTQVKSAVLFQSLGNMCIIAWVKGTGIWVLVELQVCIVLVVGSFSGFSSCNYPWLFSQVCPQQ